MMAVCSQASDQVGDFLQVRCPGSFMTASMPRSSQQGYLNASTSCPVVVSVRASGGTAFLERRSGVCMQARK